MDTFMGIFSELTVEYKIRLSIKHNLTLVFEMSTVSNTIKSVAHKIMDTFPSITQLWQSSHFDYIGVNI